MLESITEKKNHLLMYLFVLTLAGGAFMFEFTVMGFQMYAFRVVLLAGLLSFIITKQLVLYHSPLTKLVFYFLLCWVLYATCSLLWAPDRNLALHEIMYLSIGLMIYVFLVSLSRNNRFFERNLYSAWIWTLLFICVIAFWEIITASHLTGSYTEAMKKFPFDHWLQNSPVATFDNPNHLAIYLCVSIALLYFFTLKKVYVVLNAALIVICSLLIFKVSARLGMLYVYFSTLFFLAIEFFTSENKSLLSRKIKTGLLVGLTMLVGIFALHPTKAVPKPADACNGSDVMRKDLIMNGLYFTKQSYLMGVGAGGFEANIRDGHAKYFVGEMTNPHCYFIEVLAQYGVLVTGFFAVIFMYVLLLVYRDFKEKKGRLEHARIILLLVCFGLMSNANSTFLPLPLNWFIFTLIIIYTDNLSAKRLEK